ncbi:PRC-barrel domain-containing protein [Phaeobacter porticola]|uniref:PRC-barrel domain-containing protein n=1 Tax=Phaeobacter porticola TaxID=1844006 RepID=A0A1L3I9M9_9RHOB|nr:PRC-barrel domain-containing protein [Phaeobacter porticola]APG48756.1 PRC-barrel domain-containing protein [Phaeobacter porticola]
MTEQKTKTRILAGVTAAALMTGAGIAQAGTSVPRGESKTDAAIETVGAQDVTGSASINSTEGTTIPRGEYKVDGTVETVGDETPADGNETVNVSSDASTTIPRGEYDASDAAGEPLPPLDEMTVADLIGKNVFSVTGKDVGEIDYVIEQDGKVAGVIGVGGFLGLNEYTVAVPFSDMDFTRNGQLKLNSETEASLRSMPEINEDMIKPLQDDRLIGGRV